MANVSLIANVADQTASQLADGSASLVPTGIIFNFAGSAAPTGWLLCNGNAVSRTTYASLFAVIGTTYGSGDGSTTFNLPDTRGIFISGVGTQTVGGVSYTRTLGTKQADQKQASSQLMTAPEYGGFMGSASGGFGGGFSRSFIGVNDPANGNNFRTTGDYLTIGANGTPRVGAETRPANIAMNQIIKV